MDEIVKVERVDLVRIQSAEPPAYVIEEVAELSLVVLADQTSGARRRSRSLSMSHIRVPASILSNLLGDPEPRNALCRLFRGSCFTALRAAPHTVSPSGAAYTLHTYGTAGTDAAEPGESDCAESQAEPGI